MAALTGTMYCTPRMPSGISRLSAASGPYAAELNASSPKIGIPSAGPICSARSSAVFRGFPKIRSSILMAGWLFLRLFERGLENEPPFLPNRAALSIDFSGAPPHSLQANCRPVDPHSNSLYHFSMSLESRLGSPLRAPALLILAILLVSPILLPAQTADDVINAYLKARGGLPKIRAIQTERVTGTISFGPNLEGPFFVERKRTLKMHM